MSVVLLVSTIFYMTDDNALMIQYEKYAQQVHIHRYVNLLYCKQFDLVQCNQQTHHHHHHHLHLDGVTMHTAY
jgi:hypothetical protein